MKNRDGKEINDSSFELTDFENIIVDIKLERERQDEKWGIQNHAPIEWLPILVEEVGEAAKEICESYYRHTPMQNYRTELIQVAAMVVAMLENYDRDNGGEDEHKI